MAGAKERAHEFVSFGIPAEGRGREQPKEFWVDLFDADPPRRLGQVVSLITNEVIVLLPQLLDVGVEPRVTDIRNVQLWTDIVRCPLCLLDLLPSVGQPKDRRLGRAKPLQSDQRHPCLSAPRGRHEECFCFLR